MKKCGVCEKPIIGGHMATCPVCSKPLALNLYRVVSSFGRTCVTDVKISFVFATDIADVGFVMRDFYRATYPDAEVWMSQVTKIEQQRGVII